MDIITAINDYKKEIDDIGNLFYVFSNFHGRGVYDAEWKVGDIGSKYLCLTLDSAADRLYHQIISDMPDDKALKQRLDYVYFLLGMPDAWGHQDYFPVWSVEYWSMSNGELLKVLSNEVGVKFAYNALAQLNRLAHYANAETTTLKRKLDLLRQKVENKKQANPQQKTFVGRLMRADKKADLATMHKILEGKTKKDFAVCVGAMVDNGILSIQVTYNELLNEFGEIGSKATINKYRNKNNIDTETYKTTAKAIKEAFNLD